MNSKGMDQIVINNKNTHLLCTMQIERLTLRVQSVGKR